jgi:hypothetical protein
MGNPKTGPTIITCSYFLLNLNNVTNCCIIRNWNTDEMILCWEVRVYWNSRRTRGLLYAAWYEVTPLVLVPPPPQTWPSLFCGSSLSFFYEWAESPHICHSRFRRVLWERASTTTWGHVSMASFIGCCLRTKGKNKSTKLIGKLKCCQN